MTLTWSILGTGIVSIPTAVAQFTVRDAWLSTSCFLVGGFIAVVVTLFFIRRFPKRTLTAALVDTWGAWIGRIFGIWILLCLYVINCTVLRETEVFVGITILPKTSESTIGAAVMIAVAYAVYAGVEVIMRDGEFIMPLVMLIAPILFFLSLQHTDVHELMPVLADGWTPVLRGGVVAALAYALELLIGLQFVLFLRNGRKAAQDVGTAAGLVTVVLTLVTVVTVGVVGPSTHYITYPVLEAVRSIRVGRFIERLDTLYVIVVISMVFIKLAVFHYAWCVGMKDVFRLSSHRVTALTGALLVWGGGTAMFSSSDEVQRFVSHTVPLYFVVTFVGIPLLTVAVMAVKVGVQQRRVASARR